jgi:hypothetical protein
MHSAAAATAASGVNSVSADETLTVIGVLTIAGDVTATPLTCNDRNNVRTKQNRRLSKNSVRCNAGIIHV